MLSTSEDKADVVIGEENGANETQSRERRHLLTFKAAGMGGKFGPSCSPRAPLKARQACAEQRVEEMFEESKVTKKKIDQLSEAEKKLKNCLVDLKSCEATRDELRKVAIEFSGIQTLSAWESELFRALERRE